MQNRRNFLTAISSSALVGLAGCSGGTGGTETIVDDRDTVTEDRYLTYTFSANQDITIQIETTVRDGPRVDFVLLDRSELREFEDMNRFRYYESLSGLDSPGYTASGEIREGDYAYIVDNSDALEAQPPMNMNDDAARVELLIEAE